MQDREPRRKRGLRAELAAAEDRFTQALLKHDTFFVVASNAVGGLSRARVNFGTGESPTPDEIRISLDTTNFPNMKMRVINKMGYQSREHAKRDEKENIIGIEIDFTGGSNATVFPGLKGEIPFEVGTEIPLFVHNPETGENTPTQFLTEEVNKLVGPDNQEEVDERINKLLECFNTQWTNIHQQFGEELVIGHNIDRPRTDVTYTTFTLKGDIIIGSGDDYFEAGRIGRLGYLAKDYLRVIKHRRRYGPPAH